MPSARPSRRRCVDVDAAEDADLAAAHQQVLDAGDEQQRQGAQLRPARELAVGEQAARLLAPALALAFENGRQASLRSTISAARISIVKGRSRSASMKCSKKRA